MKFKNVRGGIVSEPQDLYGFRPAVYGICMDENKILVIQPSWDTKFSLPGGSMDTGESFQEALEREFMEETGYEIAAGEQPTFVSTSLYGDAEKNQYFQKIEYVLCSLVKGSRKG